MSMEGRTGSWGLFELPFRTKTRTHREGHNRSSPGSTEEGNSKIDASTADAKPAVSSVYGDRLCTTLAEKSSIMTAVQSLSDACKQLADRHGESDFEQERERIDAWMRRLSELLPPAQGVDLGHGPCLRDDSEHVRQGVVGSLERAVSMIRDAGRGQLADELERSLLRMPVVAKTVGTIGDGLEDIGMSQPYSVATIPSRSCHTHIERFGFNRGLHRLAGCLYSLPSSDHLSNK
ncbi:hypothetical protein LTR53_015365 [Teratosphaeriaceae sp. CCFEE 6253]|nr:hypothetical protein LTR53_015365 [Teratosphaeriaceae sp. CCFEE 6253]